MPTPDDLIDDLRKSHPEAFRDHATHKFGSKLTFEERCQILAAYHMKVSGHLLAEAFNVDRRTVSHIFRPASPHYKNVRKERDKLGDVDFRCQYFTDAVKARIAKAANDRRETVAMSTDEYDRENAANHAATAAKANHRAGGRAGEHPVKCLNTGNLGTLSVRYFNERQMLTQFVSAERAGWRYNVYENDEAKPMFGGNLKDAYVGDTDEATGREFRTSEEAYKFALQYHSLEAL